MNDQRLAPCETSVMEGGGGETEILRRMLSTNSRSGAGQSTDQHLPASGPRALQDTQHEDAASLLVTGVEVLALSITGLYICGHDGVSTHPYDTTQHYIAPHHTTPHLSTPHYTTPDHTTPTHTQVADAVYILIAENGFDKQACAAYVDYLQRSTHAWQKQRLVEQPQTVRCRRAASTRIDCTGSLRNVCNARVSCYMTAF